MKNLKYYASATVFLSSLLLSCSSQPMYSDVDVLKAKNTDKLYQLYERMEREYGVEKPSSDRARNIQGYQEKVGLEIANEKEQELLNSLGRDLSQHDIAKLNEAKRNAAPIQSYNDAVFVALIAQIDQNIFLKEKKFAKKRAEFQLLELDRAPRKVELLDEMAVIAGGDQAGSLRQERVTYIAGLFESAHVNMKSQRYEQVVLILNQLEVIEPEHKGLKGLEYALIEAEYEQQFWDALGSGDKNKSLALLKQLTAIPNYLQNNTDVLLIAKDLQALFLADADKNMQGMQVIAAYENYSSANYIQIKLGTVKRYSAGEENFLKVISNNFIAAQEANNIVLSYGLLSILEELQYDNALVEEFAPVINNAILEQATIKVLPRQINSKPESLEVAQVFSNALAKQIQTELKTKVIVYNITKQAQITDIEVAKNPSAWFEITGELLQANLATESSAETESKSVLVSYQTVANPEYETWSQLSSRKRKAVAEPAVTIEKSVYKDVVLSRVKISKKANLSVSYRLRDQNKNAVLFFNSQENSLSVDGVIQKGMREGLFSVEEKEAQLPLDTDIMGQLIADAVKEISLKIKPELEILEGRYLQAGEVAFVSNEYNQAAAQLAYANILALSKQKKTKLNTGLTSLEKMRLSMMRWK